MSHNESRHNSGLAALFAENSDSSSRELKLSLDGFFDDEDDCVTQSEKFDAEATATGLAEMFEKESFSSSLRKGFDAQLEEFFARQES